MIYSNEFVWLHFPKCAGRKIETLFSTYYSQDMNIHQDIVKPRINPIATWHDTIAKREKSDPSFILGNRTVKQPGKRTAGLLGKVHYDRKKQAITRFNVVGIGQAWGNRWITAAARFAWTTIPGCTASPGNW